MAKETEVEETEEGLRSQMWKHEAMVEWLNETEGVTLDEMSAADIIALAFARRVAWRKSDTYQSLVANRAEVVAEEKAERKAEREKAAAERKAAKDAEKAAKKEAESESTPAKAAAKKAPAKQATKKAPAKAAAKKGSGKDEDPFS